MSYIGISPSTAAFPFDQFSGNGTTTAFTMSYAPASTTSMVVSISGVVQNPNTYGISGLTLTFSAAPPTGTNNIAVLYLGIPATSVVSPGNTAFFSSTSFTATAGQTTFTPSGTYQVGFLNVIRNGSQLAPADYTATNGTTVVLNNACVAGDIVVIEVYNLTSLTNALPSTGGTVTGATTFNSTVSINGANGSGYTGYKNRIINGEMKVAQRGTSFSSPASITYTLDRWLVGWGGAAPTTVSQVTGPTGFKNALQMTGVAGNTVMYVAQRIESLNCSDLSGATITIQANIATSASQTVAWSLAYANSSDNYSGTTSVGSGTWSTTSTATTFTATISSLPSGVTNGLQLIIAPANSGAFTSGTITITGVQLERGSNATSFEFRDYGRELQMCYRYYIKQTGYNTKIASRYGANTVFFSYPTPVEMRAAPTVSSSSTNWNVISTTAAENSTTSTINTVLNYVGGNVDVVLNTSFNPAAYIYMAYVNSTTNVNFSAEL